MLTLNVLKLKESLELAVRMRETYESKFVKTTEISVDSFTKICSDEIGKPIEINTLASLDASKFCIKGIEVAFNDHYEIWILEEKNLCRRRFVTIKELFHVLLDCPEYRNFDFKNHTFETVTDGPQVGNSLPSAQSEFFAEYAAMEFLFPLSHRKEIIKHQPNPNYLQIATQYRIPQIYVERCLAKTHMDYFSVYTPQTDQHH